MSQYILDDIAKVGIQLILEEPFYGHFFSGLLRETNNQTDSVSLTLVEQQLTMSIQPQYWEERADFQNLKYGIIKHQLLHLALKHPFRRSRYKHPHIFDIAADLVVNQYLAPIHLPDDAITLDGYSKFKKFERLKDVDYYYRKILEINNNEQENNENSSLPNEGNSQLQQHKGWNDLSEMNSLEQRIMEGALEDAIVQAAERADEKSRGQLPDGLMRWIDQKLNPSQNLNWKRVLRLFLGSGQRTYIKNTLRRPSKRYGTTPGIQIKQHRKILVALDTSGSISPEELSAFFSEIQLIQRQGAEIMIAECDSVLQRTYILRKNHPSEVKGGGGTNFNPVIEFANQEYKPEAIVYFTDGFADAPRVVAKCPVFWMISKEGIKPEDAAWKKLEGRKVKMG